MVNNGTIQVHFKIWTENEAGRGCEEVANALVSFLESSAVSGCHLIAWSDSCAGQNKNFAVICLWQ